MAASTPTRGRARRLAELRPSSGRVLSLFFDLDPSEFATGAARATQITSLLDEAAKRIDAIEDLDHDELVQLRQDVDRVREALDPQSMGAGGARSLAVYAGGPDLLEIVPLPYPLEQHLSIGEAPDVTPLALAGSDERWCVVLVSRRDGRVFYGDEHGLEELGNVRDDTHGQHTQGGWSQRRYEDSVEEEKRDHLDRVAENLLALLRRRPFHRLVVGGPDPLPAEFEGRLHPYLAQRLAGRVSADVEASSAADVLDAARDVFESARREREQEVVGRLRAGIGRPDGRAAAGLADTLAALNEQRVEVLLLEPNLSLRGWVDGATGYLAAEPGPSPSGEDLQELDDVIDAAIEKALEQSAEVLVLRDAADLGAHRGIAALLRF